MLRAPISLAGSTRRGMVTAQVALSLSALIAMLAVVADGGLLLVERRHVQAAADAVALAATSVLNGGGGDPPAIASANGCTIVSITFPTLPPPGVVTFPAEVIVEGLQPQLCYFSGIIFSGPVYVRARAVAGVVHDVVPGRVALVERL